MKHIRHLALSVHLALSLMTSALAAEVPVSLVVELSLIHISEPTRPY